MLYHEHHRASSTCRGDHRAFKIDMGTEKTLSVIHTSAQKKTAQTETEVEAGQNAISMSVTCSHLLLRGILLPANRSRKASVPRCENELALHNIFAASKVLIVPKLSSTGSLIFVYGVV